MAKKALVAPGRYRGTVIDHDIGRSTKKETPQVSVRFGFTDKEGQPQELVWKGYFTEATLQSEHGVIKQLRELGWDIEKHNWNLAMLGRKTAENAEGGALIGLEADITVEKGEPYEGEETREIAWINSDGGMNLKPVSKASDIAQFIKEVKANASGAAPARPAAAKVAKPADKPAAAGAAVALKADDLPF